MPPPLFRRTNRSRADSRDRFRFVHKRRWHSLFGFEDKRQLRIRFLIRGADSAATTTTTTAAAAAAATSDSCQKKRGNM